MAKVAFDEVINAVWKERLYQNSKPGQSKEEDKQWSCRSWLQFIQVQATRASEELAGSGCSTAIQDRFRKIAALAIAAMENIGVTERIIKPRWWKGSELIPTRGFYWWKKEYDLSIVQIGDDGTMLEIGSTHWWTQSKIKDFLFFYGPLTLPEQPEQPEQENNE